MSLYYLREKVYVYGCGYGVWGNVYGLKMWNVRVCRCYGFGEV